MTQETFIKMTGVIDNACTNPNISLGIDEACFSILNLYIFPVIFYSIPWNAYTGNGLPRGSVPPVTNSSFLISTKSPLHIYYATLKGGNGYEYCHTTYDFKEHGSYGWNVSEAHLCSDIYVIREPTETYLPILIAFMTFVLLAIFWSTSKIIIRVIKGKLSPNNTQEDLTRLQEVENSTHPVVRTTKTSTRIRSVDTFRGICILLMIFVNNGGGKYVFFNHSSWYGLTVADLVLPWFAWIMGLTIALSKRVELRLTVSRIKIILYSLQRALILILLGLVVNSMYSKSLSELRFPGVLQLLAVSYFVCSTLEAIFMKPHSQDTLLQFGRFASIRDILDNWPQWLIIGIIVAAHTFVTFFLPVPHCPKGYLGPGGEYHIYGRYKNCTAGAAGYIDRSIFGSHMYDKTKDPVYGQILPYDPEGLMNTISAILIVYLGVHAGKILLLYYQYTSRILRWLLWAVITGIIAGILCKFSLVEGAIPISKKMMTLSFDLTCSSFAFFLYAMLYTLIDYKQIWNGAPFVYAGINPIFLYVGHILTKDLFPWSWKIEHPTHASLLAMNLWTTTLWGIIGYLLYQKDIIITV